MICIGHEEADLRIILRLKGMIENGLKYIIITSVDSEALVLATAYFFTLSDKCLETVWISFRTGKKYRFISVYVTTIWRENAIAVLVVFDAFTGHDSNSGFTEKTKKISFEDMGYL